LGLHARRFLLLGRLIHGHLSAGTRPVCHQYPPEAGTIQAAR